MTQNPFDALGGAGGLDFNALAQQAQQMQQRLMDAQSQLADTTAEGSVAGGAVRVRVNGVGELVEVTIEPGTLESDTAEALADLGDLIVAAYRDAKAKADDLAGQALGPLAGGLGGAGGLPGLGG